MLNGDEISATPPRWSVLAAATNLNHRIDIVKKQNFLISLAEAGELGEASGEFDCAGHEIRVDGQVGVARHVVHAGDSNGVGTTFHVLTQPLNTVDSWVIIDMIVLS